MRCMAVVALALFLFDVGACAAETFRLRAIHFGGAASSRFSRSFSSFSPLNSSNERKNRPKMESLSLEIFYRAGS